MAAAKIFKDLVGTKEDVMNKLYNFVPHDHPVMMQAGKGSTTNEHHQWLTDVDFTPAAGERGDYVVVTEDSYTEAEPTLVSNYAERFEVVVAVSDKANKAGTYGRGSKSQYLIGKGVKALKDGIERRLSGQNPGVNSLGASAGSTARASTSNTVGARMGNLLSFITSNVTAAGATTITRSHVDTVMQSIWTASSSSGMWNLVLSPASKTNLIASLDTVPGIRRNMMGYGGKKITNTFVGYEGAFGEVAIMPSRFVGNDVAYLLNSSKFSLISYQAARTVPLAKIDARERTLMDCIDTLQVDNEITLGAITGLVSA